MVALHKIGIITVANGRVMVPFTRLIGKEETHVEVSLRGAKAMLTLNVAAGALSVSLQPVEEDATPRQEGDLFGVAEDLG